MNQDNTPETPTERQPYETPKLETHPEWTFASGTIIGSLPGTIGGPL